MITLIGTRWKRSNVLSQGVLITRLLLGNLEIIAVTITEYKILSTLSWWFVVGVTPLPIPNREVKPCHTDDSLFKAKVGYCQDCVLNMIFHKNTHIKKHFARGVF